MKLPLLPHCLKSSKAPKAWAFNERPTHRSDHGSFNNRSVKPTTPMTLYSPAAETTAERNATTTRSPSCTDLNAVAAMAVIDDGPKLHRGSSTADLVEDETDRAGRVAIAGMRELVRSFGYASYGDGSSAPLQIRRAPLAPSLLPRNTLPKPTLWMIFILRYELSPVSDDISPARGWISSLQSGVLQV